MISVIIPVFNTREYLDKCIASVVNQSYRDLEILLIDDCSTDGSSELLERWAEKDSRIFVIHKEQNTGVSDSRNIGLITAQGDYIAFVDSDDWLDPDMYQNMVLCLEQSGADIAMGGYVRKEKEKTITVLPSCDSGSILSINDALLECMPQRGAGRYNLFIWDKLFRRTIIRSDKKVILFNREYCYGEDVLWLAEVILNCSSVVFWKSAGYYYRVLREGNSWNTIHQFRDLNLCKSAVDTNKRILELFRKEESIDEEIKNNQLQRVLFYQRYAFRTADQIGDFTEYKNFRSGYYQDLLRWYAGNRTRVGAKWLIKQVDSDVKFELRRVKRFSSLRRER